MDSQSVIKQMKRILYQMQKVLTKMKQTISDDDDDEDSNSSEDIDLDNSTNNNDILGLNDKPYEGVCWGKINGKKNANNQNYEGLIRFQFNTKNLLDISFMCTLFETNQDRKDKKSMHYNIHRGSIDFLNESKDIKKSERIHLSIKKVIKNGILFGNIYYKIDENRTFIGKIKLKKFIRKPDPDDPELFRCMRNKKNKQLK